MVTQICKALWANEALLENGWATDVLIQIDERGNISNVEPGQKPQQCERAGGVLIPGVTNLHSHAHQRAMAGLAEKSNRPGSSHNSFWSWRNIMYQYLEKIQPEDLYAIARQLYLEMLHFGYTGVAEFQYLHHDINGQPFQDRAEMTRQCLMAAQSVGIAFTALPVLYSYGGFGARPALAGQQRFINDGDEFLTLIESIATDVHAGDNCSLGIAPHSLRAVDQSLLQRVIDDCTQSELIHIHIAEQLKEVHDCLNWSGQRPVEWLLNHFDVDENWCLIHATHMSPEETRNLAASGAVAGLCPTTEANLGDGIFNAESYCSMQGRWGVGSDSHISISAVEELRWLEYGQRLMTHRRNVLAGTEYGSTAAKLYQNALTGGAQACARLTGKLAPGYRADFIVLDNNQPRLYARQGYDLIDSWIFSGNQNPVKNVFVGGVKVIADGHHVDERSIQHEYRATLDRLAA